MNKLDKFLSKADPKTRLILEQAILQILNNDLFGFDIKKLKGKEGRYRIRIGSVRIIFEKIQGRNCLLSISHKNDTTYND